ncbi:hypothetical protein MJG53_009302 [Ovis ammon polii x Ovis aries]|uniref:Uncharacterized protein n=1 Tax=Ovis ammon polii x Ovis aries TaxID=2918886 RepID=A0ACB9UW03_9CETA|nr:hypothetical protein MJG53_009302 [Ovis ammon polii x Ovis aries]
MGRGLDGRLRSVGSQGNRVQQLEPRGCLEASWFPLADMCTAEVDRHVAQRYLLKRRLGKGAYGIVWKAVDRRTGEVVAIKKIFDAFKDKTDAQRTFREIMLLQVSGQAIYLLLQEFGDHPNIVRLLDVIPAENNRDIYLVFESMDTDLNAVICKGTLLKDIHKRYIFYQLLRATKFIHSGRVIHRDQKTSWRSALVATSQFCSTWGPDALDLLSRLLVFAPHKRLSAAQALQHPYVQRFHCPAREWTLGGDVRLPVQEGAQLSAAEYRRRLHQVLRDAARVIRAQRPPLRSDPAPTPTAL